MMLKQTAGSAHPAPNKLQVFLMACLVVGMNPLASLASEANPTPTEDIPISLGTEPSELTEELLTEDCLPTMSESKETKVEATGEDAQEGLEPTELCPPVAVDSLAKDEFANADDTALVEETQDSSSPAINVNINIGTEGPLIGIGSSGNDNAFPPDDDFGGHPDPGLGEPVEEGLPAVPEAIPAGPRVLVPTKAIKSPSKQPKGLVRKTRLQNNKSLQKKRYRLKPGTRRVKSKRVQPSARRLKILRKKIKFNRRPMKSLGKRLKTNRRRMKSTGRRIRPTLRRSPTQKRQFLRIKTVRPMMRRP